MMKLVLAVILVVLSFQLSAQEMGKEEKDGKVYLVHVAERGNTLYGLHTKYNVSIEELIEANPNIEAGIQVGQKIYIPFKEKAPSTTMHIVKKGETMYGISKQYKTTVETLLQLNPSLTENLNIGDELVVPYMERIVSTKVEEGEPEIKEQVGHIEKTEIEEITPAKYSASLEDSVIHYEVQKKETIYSISKRFMVPIETLKEINKLQGNGIQEGQILIIPVKGERKEQVEIKAIDNVSKKIENIRAHKSKYNILVALPLNLSSNPDILSGLYTDKTLLNKVSDVGLEFLMGAQMAIDSLEKLGLNGEVEFFDTRANLEVLKEKLNNSTKKWDLIIGPFYPNLYEYASRWGLENKTPVIAVTKVSTSTLENNPYAISVVPSTLTLLGGMAKYLAKNTEGANVVIISGENNEVKNRVDYFLDIYNKYNTGNSIRQTSVGDASGKHLLGYIDVQKKNYIICLSDNVQQVMRFINALNAAKNTSPKYGKSDVVVVGTREWKEISALNHYYRNRFQFHYAATKYLNYELPNSIRFVTEYRNRYESDPSKYAFHGFDVMLSQCSSLLLGIDRNHGLMSNFNLQSLGEGNGKENSSAFISKQEDFEIKLLEIVK